MATDYLVRHPSAIGRNRWMTSAGTWGPRQLARVFTRHMLAQAWAIANLGIVTRV
jgi:hypothetical protein